MKENLTRQQREVLARKRLLSVVGRHGAAIARTIEQKIADAGPLNQRIDPHIVGTVRNAMVQAGDLAKRNVHGRDWFALPDAPPDLVTERIETQWEVVRLTIDNAFTRRVGDVLEIATQRALRQAMTSAGLFSFGGFRKLTDAPTTGPLKKEEPPSILGGRELSGNKRFDFIAARGQWIGIECKNVREWIYPDRAEVRETLQKAVELDIPATLIARRIPYVTRRLLQVCGILCWEVFNQLYPPEYANLAPLVQHKEGLGFFDVRVTDTPNKQLVDFVGRILPAELEAMRQRFDQYKDLLAGFADGSLPYKSFSARVRRREKGLPEDFDDQVELPESDDEFNPFAL